MKIMKLQISSFFSRRERSKSINYEFEMKEFHFEGDLMKPVEKVSVDGVITSKESELVLNLRVKTKLKVTCSRCLDTFIYPIDIDIEERFTNNKELDSEEIMFVDGDTLDITEIIENSIISTLPIKRLCKEDCNGLCSQCGANKNVENCSCLDYDVDVRLAKLRELFGE